MKCNLCGTENSNNVYFVKEMMFGTRDVFKYFQCSKCNCLQLSQFPVNISEYYPDNYYSYKKFRYKNLFEKFLIRIRNDYALKRKGILGRFVNNFKEALPLNSLSHINLDTKMDILDVGCGNGILLFHLKELGFKNLLGIDPYIENDIEYSSSLKILKVDLNTVEGKWDLIMFHHVFEHLLFPIDTLKKVWELLKPNGICIIRLPTVTSYAWEKYKENWVQIDAPRHFFLHSRESMELIASKTNFIITDIIYDSRAFQFWGSEQYLKDIPLFSEKSYFKNPRKSIFTKNDIKYYKKRSIELNDDMAGDQAVYYLKKSGY